MGFLLPALASIGGSIVGEVAAGPQRDAAQRAIDEALAEIQQVGAPPDLSAEIIREKLKQVGVYTPKMEEAIVQESSKLAQVKEDPTIRDAQTKALQLLQQRSATGLGAEERAAFNELRREAAREAEGKRQQILQSMQARGMAGSGAELAAQLSSSQAGDEALSAGGDRIAAAAARNALDSIMNSASLGGQIRGQDFDVASTKARAEDELNRFNTQNQISRQTRNVGAGNEAQLANLREQQRISDANTMMANEEKLRQANAQRQYWADKMTQAQAKSNALTARAGQHQAQAQRTADIGSGIGSGVGGAIGGYQADIKRGELLDRLYPVAPTPASPAINIPKPAILPEDLSMFSQEDKKRYY